MYEGNTVDELIQELAVIDADSQTLRNHAETLCNYTKTLALLRALKAGTVSLDNVNMVADGWTVVAVEPPAEPVEDPLDNPLDNPIVADAEVDPLEKVE